MNHPFGDLLYQHLHRRHGLTQSKLAAGILQDPAVISNMCRGRRLTGKQARERVVDIVGWLHAQEVLTTQDEANAMLHAAGLISLQQDVPAEADLLAALAAAVVPINESPVRRTPTNLPAQLTSFVGRESATLAVADLLARHRLVTLTGVGGIGKTRLAIESAISLLEEGAPITFPGGIWLAPLASLSEPSLLAESVVRSLTSIHGVSGAALETLIEFLADKELLLILDNCEHLVDACAELVETLLQRCWHLRVLATSREALRIPGERVLAVDPLAVAQNGPAVDGVPAAAPRLFMDRARVLQPDIRFDPSDLETIDHICRRLDGIPLALELAASRAPQVSLNTIAGQLDRQMDLLSSLYRTTIPRHHTMQAALAWSHGLLTPDAQQLLARLSVFAGGWHLAGAQAVAPDLPLDQVSLRLFELVDKSLVIAERGDQERRYRLLEPVRQFALLQLRKSGEEEWARQQMAEYFLALAEQGDQDRDTANETIWLQRMQPEVDNIRTVNRWALAQKDAEFAQRFNAMLFLYHAYGSDTSEAQEWYREALALESDAQLPSAAEARALASTCAGYCASICGNYLASERYFEEAVTQHALCQDQIGIANSLRGWGYTNMCAGNLDTAQVLIERALQGSIDADDPVGTLWGRFDLAVVVLAGGQYVEAQGSFDATLQEFRVMDIPYGIFRSLQKLAYIVRQLGDSELAYRLYREALSVELTSQFLTVLNFALEGVAGLDGEAGLAERGATLLGASDSFRRFTGFDRYFWQESRYQHDLAHIRGQLGEEAWAAAWANGQTMTADEAVRYGLA